MKNKTLFAILAIVVTAHVSTEPVQTGLSSDPETGFESLNAIERIEEPDLSKGHTSQPDFKFATESPKQDASSHTSGPITMR
jgi:hypothetical protein